MLLKTGTTGTVQELARAFRNSVLTKSVKDPRDYSLKHTRTHKTLIPSAEHVFRQYCVYEMSITYTLYLHMLRIYVYLYIHTHALSIYFVCYALTFEATLTDFLEYTHSPRGLKNYYWKPKHMESTSYLKGNKLQQPLSC